MTKLELIICVIFTVLCGFVVIYAQSTHPQNPSTGSETVSTSQDTSKNIQRADEAAREGLELLPSIQMMQSITK
jgi:hypothetical protein